MNLVNLDLVGLPVAGILVEHGQGRLVLGQGERTRANRVVGEILAWIAGTGKNVLRNNVHVPGNRHQFGWVSLLEGHNNGVGIGRSDAAEIAPNTIRIGCRVLFHRIEGKRDIVCRKRLAVVPFDVLPNREGDRCVVATPRVVAGQHRCEGTIIDIYEVQGLINQAQDTRIGVTVIWVPTRLGKIVGLGSNFENLLATGTAAGTAGTTG